MFRSQETIQIFHGIPISTANIQLHHSLRENYGSLLHHHESSKRILHDQEFCRSFIEGNPISVTGRNQPQNRPGRQTFLAFCGFATLALLSDPSLTENPKFTVSVKFYPHISTSKMEELACAELAGVKESPSTTWKEINERKFGSLAKAKLKRKNILSEVLNDG